MNHNEIAKNARIAEAHNLFEKGFKAEQIAAKLDVKLAAAKRYIRDLEADPILSDPIKRAAAIKEVLRLVATTNISKREIGRKIGVSEGFIKRYAREIKRPIIAPSQSSIDATIKKHSKISVDIDDRKFCIIISGDAYSAIEKATAEFNISNAIDSIIRDAASSKTEWIMMGKKNKNLVINAVITSFWAIHSAKRGIARSEPNKAPWERGGEAA